MALAVVEVIVVLMFVVLVMIGAVGSSVVTVSGNLSGVCLGYRHLKTRDNGIIN